MRLVWWTALAMLAFAGNSLLNRLAVGSGAIDAISFAVLRLCAGALCLVVLMLWRRIGWPESAGRLLGVAGLLTYLFGFSVAYVNLAAGTGALILFGMVQITMFCGALVAGEAISRWRWLGAALAFAGLVYLVAPSLALGAVAPMVAMAFAGIGWGIYSLAGRRSAQPLAATGANFVLAVPLALAICALHGVGVISPRGVGLAILSGAVTSALGYALWYRLVPQLGASRAAVAQLTVPVLAAAGGIALGEALSLRFVIATVVVLGGVAVASR